MPEFELFNQVQPLCEYLYCVCKCLIGDMLLLIVLKGTYIMFLFTRSHFQGTTSNWTIDFDSFVISTSIRQVKRSKVDSKCAICI